MYRKLAFLFLTVSVLMTGCGPQGTVVPPTPTVTATPSLPTPTITPTAGRCWYEDRVDEQGYWFRAECTPGTNLQQFVFLTYGHVVFRGSQEDPGVLMLTLGEMEVTTDWTLKPQNIDWVALYGPGDEEAFHRAVCQAHDGKRQIMPNASRIWQSLKQGCP